MCLPKTLEEDKPVFLRDFNPFRRQLPLLRVGGRREVEQPPRQVRYVFVGDTLAFLLEREAEQQLLWPHTDFFPRQRQVPDLAHSYVAYEAVPEYTNGSILEILRHSLRGQLFGERMVYWDVTSVVGFVTFIMNRRFVRGGTFISLSFLYESAEIYTFHFRRRLARLEFISRARGYPDLTNVETCEDLDVVEGVSTVGLGRLNRVAVIHNRLPWPLGSHYALYFEGGVVYMTAVMHNSLVDFRFSGSPTWGTAFCASRNHFLRSVLAGSIWSSGNVLSLDVFWLRATSRPRHQVEGGEDVITGLDESDRLSPEAQSDVLFFSFAERPLDHRINFPGCSLRTMMRNSRPRNQAIDDMIDLIGLEWFEESYGFLEEWFSEDSVDEQEGLVTPTGIHTRNLLSDHATQQAQLEADESGFLAGEGVLMGVPSGSRSTLLADTYRGAGWSRLFPDQIEDLMPTEPGGGDILDLDDESVSDGSLTDGSSAGSSAVWEDWFSDSDWEESDTDDLTDEDSADCPARGYQTPDMD